MAATAEHFTADDEIQILDSIGNWLDKEVRPVVKHFDHEDEYPEDLVAQMKDLGLFSLMYPVEHGGL